MHDRALEKQKYHFLNLHLSEFDVYMPLFCATLASPRVLRL
jgi:hypothetical protein